mmetsp:Transcript_3109/g.5787  ORF Transcript_3109/g.5787 Transcript_3109/m.5787 type:complete len:1064 (-) Transcript_3109:263-3454(-)
METLSLFYLGTNHSAAEGVAEQNSLLVVALPQWVVDFHQFRKALFLRTVEPVIEYLLGPAEEQDTVNVILAHDGRRRLGLLPHYVQDMSVFRETSMSFATLVMLFTIMTCVLLIFLSCFYHNQKTAPLFASPRRHRLPKLVPPPLPVDGTFTWIKVCFYMSDEEIINRVGFDSLIFIRFHRLALRCIVKMSVFSFIVLLPLNYTGGGHASASDLKEYVDSLVFSDFLKFTMANIKGGSPRLWAHCVAAYLLSAIVMRELVVEYNAFNNIRHRYMMSKEPHLRTVLVTNIPRHLRSPKKIRNYFKHVYPNAVNNVTMCQNLILLEKLVEARNHILNKIEKEILILCRNEKKKLVGSMSKILKITTLPFRCFEDVGFVPGASDRLALLYNRLQNMNEMIQAEHQRRARVMKKLDKMEAKVGRKDIDYILATPFLDHESQSSVSESTVEEPVIRRNVGNEFKGLGSGFDYVNLEHEDEAAKKRRSRPFANAKQAIKRYTKSVFDASLIGRPVRRYEESGRKNSSNGPDAIENHYNEVSDKAFVEMKTFTASTIAIQSMHSSKPGAMEVKTAPEPRDILWENIYVSKGARRTRGYIGDTIVILLISFYVVPVTLISLLVSESALVSISPRLAQLDEASAFFSTAIGLVQPICLIVIQQLLPPLFMLISKAEGLVSFSEVQMKAFSRYFMFQVLNVFLVTAIAGTIFDTLAIIIEKPEKAFQMLGNSLPRMSSFFISLVTMKTFLGLGVELVRALHIVQSLLRYIFFPKATLRMKKKVLLGMRAIDDPGWFPFHKILAQDMLVVVISVVFAVVAPIVLFPCAMYCLFSRIMWTHHHLYVYESVFESGGQFWPKIFRRFIFGLIIAQMTITGQFIVKEARHEAYATIALMFISYLFLRSTRARYDPPSSTLPLEVATIMDITVAQEVEAKKQRLRAKGLETKEESDDDNNCFLGDFDPFEHAYCQPALRANPVARPEQPFPPGQLGTDEFLSCENFEGLKEGDLCDDKATVRLKSLNHRDRKILNHWWSSQMQAAGQQKLLSVLVGNESGTLRLGRRGPSDDEEKRQLT